ncbi:MAG: thioredoxin [Candidatus Izemoplasmatales bacterium]|jgi:thioredoxin 1|nr:thioredoxin [Candidatus Izemoplasmatales bacterium]MDD3865020.1 thioredoxin [Candidatus Izemoplasmatales bacterium]
MAIEITDSNFKTEVLDSKLPVIVDFWAPWCRPCMMLGPTILEIAEELEGKVKVGKLNVDNSETIARRYSVSSIPTVILFKDGAIVKKVVGLMRKEDLLHNLGL